MSKGNSNEQTYSSQVQWKEIKGKIRLTLTGGHGLIFLEEYIRNLGNFGAHQNTICKELMQVPK